MDLNEFIKRLKDLKAKGYVKSTRKGPTGVGHTFEHYIGIKENNLALPDMEKFELKAHREGASNLITLFTFNKGAWIMDPLDAIKKYGTIDEDGRKGMYFTMSPNTNSTGLYLDVQNDSVAVKGKGGEVVVRWKFDDIADQFIKKIPGQILVSAKTKEENGAEWFNFCSAKLLKGATPTVLKKCIKDGIILIDLRLHDKGTMARNHGTGFRVYEKDLDKIFASSETLL